MTTQIDAQATTLIVNALCFIKRDTTEDAAEAVRIVGSFINEKAKISEVCRMHDKLVKSSASFAAERLLCALVRAIDGSEIRCVQEAVYEAIFAAGESRLVKA